MLKSFLGIVRAILANCEGEVVPKSIVSGGKTWDNVSLKLLGPIPVDLLNLVSHVKVSPSSTYENRSKHDRLPSPLLHLGSEVVQIAEPLTFVPMSRDYRFVLETDANAAQVRTSDE